MVTNIDPIILDIIKSKIIWFDHDCCLVKIVKVILGDNSSLKSRGLEQPGVFISHAPYRDIDDYFVGFSYFEDLQIRSLSQSQLEFYDKCLRQLGGLIGLNSFDKILNVFVEVNKECTDINSNLYILSLSFDIDKMPLFTFTN